MLAFFSIGAIMGLLMKFELLAPGKTIMDAQTYNAFFTVHGVIMIFVIVIPGLPAVFGNFFLPIMIGAKDVAFPRINLLSWYIYILGIILVIISLVAGDGAPDTGWTFLCALQLLKRPPICYPRYLEPLCLVLVPYLPDLILL
jgi:cytochrome c oxidase subunit 1